MLLRNAWQSLGSTFRRWPNRATEAHVMFPAFAVLILVVLWGKTLDIIKIQHAGAEHAATILSRELVETYEAQVLRTLRDIDQTLGFVRYAYELNGGLNALPDLEARELLPPHLLFAVSIADREGDIVASTGRSRMTNVATQSCFRKQRKTDTLSIGMLIGPAQERKLQFSRRLNAADGTFAGIVMITVDADYFVSSYDASKLGNHGMLGILGTDGVFRVRRTGDSVFSDDVADYASLVPGTDSAGTEVVASTHAWDGVQRYMSVRRLYEYPLAVIVGLSADEQLAAARRAMQVDLGWATATSVLLILCAVALGRMSWQLAQSRRRENEATAAHAERVEYLACHDNLTSLPNRFLFSKLLSQGLQHAHRYHKQLVVLFLDLDRFKQINDTLGHEAGDQLLQETANRLKACLRDRDTVARLGGDEFVVLLTELSEKEYVATVAQRLLAAIAKPFVLQGQEFRVSASIGISTYPQAGLDEQTLMKNADIAMYHAKEKGKNNFQFYCEKLNANSFERLGFESSLRQALGHHEFQLHYQAKQDMHSGRITGMEALLRWQHPELGTVAPLQFLPIAEETGLIVPIGKWVLRTACQQNVIWQKQGLPRLSMAVNLTTRQFFDEQLLPDLASILETTGMDARLLELEITESLLMHNVEKSLRVLTRLRNLGIRIAIDGFGTGYSSLSRLRQFPFDTIKIDHSLIHAGASGALNKELTEVIIAAGKTLSLTVVAQGVETKEQADFLRERACDQLQGFYFNKPVPADEFAQLLRTQTNVANSDAYAGAFNI